MDLLRKPWLGRVVKETLTEIMQWRSADSPSRTKDNYQIIGDRVWVKMGKCNPLQIAKFLTFDGEIQARLSDTDRMVDATFSFAAVDAERARKGRRFTEGTSGGIIHIEDCEIRVRWTANAPWPRLVLYVHQATFMGSGGEGIFGHPLYIRYDDAITGLLAKISTLDLSDHEPTQCGVEAEPSMQSRGGDGQFGGEKLGSAGGEETRDEFATQIHRPRLAVSDRRDRSGVEAERYGLISVMMAARVPARIKERAKVDLLGILLPERRASLGREALGEDGPCVAQEASKDSSSALEGGTPIAVGRDDIRLREPILDPPSETVNIAHTEVVAQTQARVVENVDRKGDNVTTTPTDESGRVDGAGKGVVGGTTTSRGGQANLAAGEELGADPWAGMTRIPRREVRIPKNQGELLSSKNCWIPPEPGNRLPVANIPVPILRSLAFKAERSALREREAAEAAKNPAKADSQPEDSSSTGSDSELEWSPSPVRPRPYVRVDEMPVDSSSVGTSPASNRSQSGITWRSTEEEGVHSRRKHEKFLSDVSPTAKRQRKGGYSEKEQKSAQKDGEGAGGRGSLQHPIIKPQSSLADRKDFGEGISSSPCENTNRQPIGALNRKSKEGNSLRGLRNLISPSTPDSAFSPIDNGTQVSEYRQAKAANGEAVVEVEHTGTELEIESLNYQRRQEQLEPGIDATAEQAQCVLNTLDRSLVSCGKIDGLDSDEEHELEITLPAALGDEADSVGLNHQSNRTSSPRLPSTAPQPQESVLQVKQTPYLHGEATKKTLRHNLLVSRKEAGSPGLHSTDLSSDLVIPCTFPSAENLAEDLVRTSGGRGGASDYNVGDSDEYSILASSQVGPEYQRHSQLPSLGKMDNKKGSTSRGLGTESAPRDPAQVGTLRGYSLQKVNLMAGAMGKKPEQTGGYIGHAVVNGTEKGSNEGGEATGESNKVKHKRQYSETEGVQQKQPRKRLKRFKLPVSFAFSQENRQFLDTSEIARNYRQEFFTSLSGQASPVLELSSTPPSAQGSREPSLENMSPNLSMTKEPGAEPHVAVDLGLHKVDTNIHQETAGNRRVVGRQVTAPVERVSQVFGSGPQQIVNSDEAKCNYLEKHHSELQITARNGMEESCYMEDAFPATEKSSRIVLIESQSTAKQTSTSMTVFPPLTPNPVVSRQGATAVDLKELGNIPSTTFPLESAPMAASVAPRRNDIVAKERSREGVMAFGHAAVGDSAKSRTTNPTVATTKRSPSLGDNASGQTPQKLPRSDIHRGKARPPADRASKDSSSEYSSDTTRAERLALLRTFIGDTSPNLEAYTDARLLNTLKNVVTTKQISREDFSRALLQVRKSLDPNCLTAQVSEPGGSLRPSPRVSSSKLSRKNPAISAPMSSNTPLKILLSSPAHMKAKVPSSVLDWLEKTSSVGSESADNVSDSQEQKWWHDRNTPFKEWSRAYVSLKSVKGEMGKVDREKGKIVPPHEKMDVLGWSL